MSRRTKLIIATLFLVLLTIPVGYVALTWTTAEPLRFQITAYHEPSSPQAWPGHGKLELRVENVSHLPVHLSHLTREDLSRGVAQLQAVSLSGSGDSLVIPPHSSVSCVCRTFPTIAPPTPWENVAVSYFWKSGTKVRYDEICHWLYAHSPAWLQRTEVHFLLLPKTHIDTTKLSPSKP